MKTIELTDECYTRLVQLGQEQANHLTPENMLEFLVEATDKARHAREKQAGRFPCHRLHCFELSEQPSTVDVEMSTHSV